MATPIPENILISRTDSIGDVVLTLPVAAQLKQFFPGCRIGFIGKPYTRPVIEACSYVDDFLTRDAFLQGGPLVCGQRADTIIHVLPDAAIALKALRSRVRTRVGTTNRLFHWPACNRLVKLSRRHSPLHEAQLNLRLLQPFGYDTDLSIDVIGNMFGLTRLQSLPARFAQLLANDKYNLILHPKSQGSAREWGLDHFISLVGLLDKNHFRVFISGTAAERKWLDPLFAKLGDGVTDITGAMKLDEFMAFIAQADGLVANSTGPLHIAAALGRDAYGIYPPMPPIHPGRWAPLGKRAMVFVVNKACEDCRKDSSNCHCIKEITPQQVAAAIYTKAKKFPVA